MFIDYRSRHEKLDEPVDLLPVLPASIETLILFSSAEEVPVTFTLEDLRKKRKECLPSLKTFVCEEDTISIAEGLEDECAYVGIDLVCPFTSLNDIDVRSHTVRGLYGGLGPCLIYPGYARAQIGQAVTACYVCDILSTYRSTGHYFLAGITCHHLPYLGKTFHLTSSPLPTKFSTQ